jgi:hypothetical protein
MRPTVEVVDKGKAFARERQSSFMSRSSKSLHVGMMVSSESDHTMRTRSSR